MKVDAKLREFTVKDGYALRSFPLLLFGSKRYTNAPKGHQMALKSESFTDESFKCKWSSLYVHVSIGHALSTPYFYYSLLLNVCDFKGTVS